MPQLMLRTQVTLKVNRQRPWYVEHSKCLGCNNDEEPALVFDFRVPVHATLFPAYTDSILDLQVRADASNRCLRLLLKVVTRHLPVEPHGVVLGLKL